MKWLASIVRVAGVSSPFTAWLVQIDAEISSAEVNSRLKKLEDPISMLHEDIPAVSKVIYSRLQEAESDSIDLDPADYQRFGRALSVLDSSGHVSGRHAIGARYAAGLRVSDPSYILYLCAQFERAERMRKLVEMVESCRRGQSVRAQGVMAETRLPYAVVVAVFQMYEAKGYGMCSREIGLNRAYTGSV